MKIRQSCSVLFRARQPGMQRFLAAATLSTAVSLLLLPAVRGAIGQQDEPPMHNPSGLPPPNPLANPKPDANAIMEFEMQRRAAMQRIEKLNTLRQKEMTSETAMLLALARDVHAKTAADPKSLSAIEMHKIEAIEKLARSVREKMEFTVTP